MFKIVIINGYPQSGKDTFVRFVNNTKVVVHNCHTSTPAKDAFITAGWDGRKTPEIRKALSDCMVLFEDLFGATSLHIDKQIQYCRSLEIKNEGTLVVLFIHIREPENIAKYREILENGHEVMTLLIDRETKEDPSNTSDENVEGYNYDYIIENNNSLEELQERAEAFVEVYL